ncbi:MAG: right-handed parallel beta-helix repeat-containing protein [Actinomycetota bacterium]|nr:right-handed parallel beta-helix repeat-containing protein [Actinomycetota bacterium]
MAASGRPLSRRRLLQAAAAGGALTVLPTPTLSLPTARWSDPRSWGGKIPGRRDIAVLTRPILLDIDAHVAGVVIKAGTQLVFDPQGSRSLKSSGNVVVNGKLVMRPARPSFKHSLTFINVDEEAFVGGGHEVLKSDVGVWVMHHGSVDIAGSPKTEWGRATGSIASGSTSVELGADPLGWRPGDEIVLCPTAAPTVADHHSGFHRARVDSVSGRVVAFDVPTPRAYPEVGVSPGRSLTSEVLNLTRNVRIQGTAGGRSHFFVHSAHPQSIRYAAFRHVGPRRASRSHTTSVLGRYGVHFHHSYDGSRGSIVKGVVVRECGNHSFVPHTSHGVTFKRCIAYDVLESPYWWDEGDPTNNTTWTDCVAALVRFDNPVSALDLTGFFLGRGEGNAVRRSVATGVHGQGTASGFEWPPAPADGLWVFEDCVAHNNQVDGIFVWQVNPRINVVSNFVGYHNGKAGIEHGSFLNSFRYLGTTLFGNATTGLALHANSQGATDGEGLAFDNLRVDGAGISPTAITISRHLEDPQMPTRVNGGNLRGYASHAIRIAEGGGPSPGLEDFVGLSIGDERRDLEPEDFDIYYMVGGGRVRVQNQTGDSAYQIDSSKSVTPIEPFA